MDIKGKKIHLIGAKGTGVAALAELLVAGGATVTGSDVADEFYTDAVLRDIGVRVTPFDEKNITRDISLVIRSAAYGENNKEVAAANSLSLPSETYTKALGNYSTDLWSAGVAGVHGKTSTTALIGYILSSLPLPAQILTGSACFINKNGNKCCTITTSNFSGKESDLFIAETCEYQRHFMDFHPKAILLTSVESDHEDYYPTLKDIMDAFADYINLLPQGGLCVYCKSDNGAATVVERVKIIRPDIKYISYGYCNSDYEAQYLGAANGETHFLVNGTQFSLSIPGRHEALDAAGALALVSEILKLRALPPLDYIDDIKRALHSFKGGARRAEIIGEGELFGSNLLIVDDYGHHPTAIKTTLMGFKEFFSGRKVIVDFMSHTYSRTAALLKEFGESFSSADIVILHKIYSSARERAEDFSITGRTLFDEVKKHNSEVYYTEEILDALDLLKNLLKEPLDKTRYPNGYLFVTMGAGDNFRLGHALNDLIKL